jgi:hypothetical protein
MAPEGSLEKPTAPAPTAISAAAFFIDTAKENFRIVAE